ncbi:hypothetical protein [Kitasatospora sp. NPDC048538]|uniref:hypothetical protein n=1 Tax=unclassified Kitasatospora TaxID=2633591 RepID=UPI0033DBBD1E
MKRFVAATALLAGLLTAAVGGAASASAAAATDTRPAVGSTQPSPVLQPPGATKNIADTSWGGSCHTPLCKPIM